MLEAVVGVALRAILASVLLGGVLAALVLTATRALALTAATRHALWTTALIATAVMPLAGVGVSVARAYARSTPAVTSHAVPLPAVPAGAGHASISADAARYGAAAAKSAHAATNTTASDSSAAPRGPSLLERLAFTAWTPRITRELARGVVALWALGALIGLFGLAGSIARVRGLKRRSSPLDGTLADELPWLTAADAGREIYLRLSYEIETPVAIGFRRPVILIPTELATTDGLAAIESLVLHEHAHLRRYDDWTNLVQRTIERIFWFNPVVWLVGRRIALEREIASDDAVVEKTGEAHAYATSLWKLAREMRMPEHAVVAPGALLTRKQITVRIEQLLDKKRARLHRSPAAALGVALAGVLAVAFVGTSAPAVELPAAEAAPLAGDRVPAGLDWHASPKTPKQSVSKQVAAKPASPARTTRSEAAAKNVRTIYRYEIAASAPVKPVVRERIVYLHDSRLPARSGSDSSSPAAMPAAPPMPERLAQSNPLAEAPRPAAVPPAPPVVVAPTMPAQALETLRTAVRAQARNIGTDTARAIRDAMASLPREIAQESRATTARRGRYDGVKLTRELIASCTGCSFRNGDMRGLDLHDLRITGNDFTGADMRGANLAGAQLNGDSLARANLANADLRGAMLNGVELTHANFEGALLEGVRLNGVSLQNVTLRGVTLRSMIGSCSGCDFSRMDLHGQDLHGIVLNGADMSHTDLRSANLSGVRFSGVDLSHADLGGADLTNARLDGCDLTHVNLRGARISGMTMTGSGFDG